jgi:hypothetical protein
MKVQIILDHSTNKKFFFFPDKGMNIDEWNIGGLKVYSIPPPTVENNLYTDCGIFILHGRKQAALTFMEDYQDFLMMMNAKGFHLFVIDQRNHGERLLDQDQNRGKENPNHAKDMYAIQLGTAWDVSYLTQTIPLYIPTIRRWGVVGFSLGGHASLLSLVQSPTIQVGVSIVGCGDYEKLMVSIDYSLQ